MREKRKVVNCDNQEFESIRFASRYFGVHMSSIISSIKNGTKIKQKRWRYLDQDFVKPKTPYKRGVIREDGVEFESVSIAAKEMKCERKAIHHAITNNSKSKGFNWVYSKPREFNQDMIEGEIWKPHPTLSINVSDKGRVNNFRITYGSNRLGYKQVRISYKNYGVHRLVAETFLPNPDNLPQVDHIDCDKSNNKVSNLRWCTAKQNSNWYHKKEE